MTEAINKIDADGGTNVGAGVKAACEVLESSVTGSRRGAAILLTDGQGALNDEHQCFVLKRWRIFAIGFGDSDDALLQRVAAETRGSYKRITSVASLTCEFQRIRAEVAGPQRHRARCSASSRIR